MIGVNILLFILSLVFAQNENVLDPTLKKYTRECRNQTGVSVDLIGRFRNGDFIDGECRSSDERLKIEFEKLKRHFLCVGKKFGLASESGAINVHLLRQRVMKAKQNTAETERIVNKCVVNRDTPEDAFYELSKCIHLNVNNFTAGD